MSANQIDSAYTNTAWLLLVSGGVCTYCLRDLVPLKKPQVTIDHVIPRSWGGPKNLLYNKVIACTWCNGAKANLECKMGGKKVRMTEKVIRFLHAVHTLASKTTDPAKVAMFKRMGYQMQESCLVHLWLHEEGRERRLYNKVRIPKAHGFEDEEFI